MQLPAVADARRNGAKAVPKSRAELSQKNRIIEALGSVSHTPRVEEEPLFRYYTYLTEHLDFPFIAHFPKPMNSEEEDEFCCTVLMLLDPANTWATSLTVSSARPARGHTRSPCRSSTCICPMIALAFN